DLLHAGTNAAEVAAVNIGVDIDHGSHVVVIDNLRGGAASHGDHIREQLGAAGRGAGIAVGRGSLVRAGADSGVGRVGGTGGGCLRGGVDAAEGHAQGRAQQRVERIVAILRGLHVDAVADARAPVEKLGGRDLSAGTERNQQAGGHVALRQPHLSGLGAVDVDIDRGVVHHLVYVDVGRAGNARHLFSDLTRQRVIGGGVTRQHLDIDGGRQSKIQNLIGDIGGFKEKDHVGKLLVEAPAQAVGVLGGGAVLIGFERNQDVAVRDAERRVVAEGQVKAAIGDSNVVDDVGDFLGWHHLANLV